MVNFLKGIFRNGGDVEVFMRSSRSPGSGENSCAALNGPCQQYLRWSLIDSLGNLQNYRVFKRAGFYPMPQWSKSQQHDPFVVTNFQ